jgi:hypothetical protein
MFAGLTAATDMGSFFRAGFGGATGWLLRTTGFGGSV